MINQDGSRRLGRPRSSEKHDRIVEAAKTVFRDEGFAASMDRIAALAGVSKQTVYAHFGSKEELYRAMHSRVPWFTHEMLEPSLPVETALTRFGTALLRKLTAADTIALHRRLIGQAETFPDLARLHDELGASRSIQALAAYLAGVMGDGRLRPEEPAIAAEHFMSLAHGLLRQRLLFGSVEPPDEAAIAERVRRAVEVFLRAYAP